MRSFEPVFILYQTFSMRKGGGLCLAAMGDGVFF